MRIVDLGLMDYQQAWRLQEAAHEQVCAGEQERVFLVEHPPVITFGRRPGIDRNLIAAADQLASLGVEVVQSDRGGDITFHGPGQLVVYPIVRLADHRLSVSGYVHALESVIIESLKEFGVPASTEPAAVGVWTSSQSCSPAKVCAIGVRVRRGVTLHGLALNVTTDLRFFDLIVPCGLPDRPVTSLQKLLVGRVPTLSRVKEVVIDQLFKRLEIGLAAHPCVVALLLLMIALNAAGCMGEGLPGRHPATSAPGSIQLSDAKSLDDLESDDRTQINLTDKLSWPQTQQPVYFGEADQFDSDNSDTPVGAQPLIAIHPGTEWKGVPLVGRGLVNAGWKYVGAGPARLEIWGLLDTVAGDSRGDFVVAHSTDGAETFNLMVVRKPCKLAEVYDFTMSRTGRGRITLTLDTDVGPFHAGLYHYDTTDHGKTWSKSARYEPDAMVRADSVPDQEQPTPVEKPQLVLGTRNLRRQHP